VKDNYIKAYESLLKKYGIKEGLTTANVQRRDRPKREHGVPTVIKAFIYSFHSDYIERYLNDLRQLDQ